MNISLSWDLFVVVFFAIILAYSFIVGRKQSIKIIIAIYVSFLTADAAGHFFGKTIGYSIPAKLFAMDPMLTAIVIKSLMFIVLIVLLSRHHAFDVQIEDGNYELGYVLSTIFVGILAAALILTTIFYFTSGNTLTLLMENRAPTSLASIRSQSEFARKIIDNSYFWFFLPTLSLITLMFWNRK